jgi:hypothetical protein
MAGVVDRGLDTGTWALWKGSAGVEDLDISHALLKSIPLGQLQTCYHPVRTRGFNVDEKSHVLRRDLAGAASIRGRKRD